jgi:hypothetical protein
MPDFFDGQADGFRDNRMIGDPHLHHGDRRGNPVRHFDVGFQGVPPQFRPSILSQATSRFPLVRRMHNCHRSPTLISHHQSPHRPPLSV